MSLTISDGLANARLEATRDFIDTGSGNGRVRFYATTQPDSGEAPGGSPLVEAVLAKPCGVVSARVLTLAQLEPAGDMIALDGTALWARVVNGNGDFVMDGDVSDDSGTGVFKIAGTTGTLLYAGGSLIMGTTALG